METLSLSTNDICQHFVTFGMDIYPPIEIPDVRTRLNMFYEQARERWGRLVDQLVASDAEFRISKKFQKHPDISGPSVPIETFVLTHRGPVCVIPLKLPEPVGETGLEATHVEDFNGLRRLFFDAIPDHVIMRLGLVRDLIFETGDVSCDRLLTDQRRFANAEMIGGKVVFKYRDAKYNHNIVVEPVSVTKTTQLAIGATIDESAGYGARVQLDINNFDVQRPLEEAEIEGVIERATSLWPEKLLEYLNERSRS